MGHLPVELLIDGVVRTLREAVLPAVTDRFARGQLFAALDVLANLRDRVDVKTALLDDEAASATDALRRAADALPADEAAPLHAALQTVPVAPAVARVAALRDALVLAFGVLAALPDERTTAARGALGEHLAAQAMRDIMTLKPSLLEEISKG